MATNIPPCNLCGHRIGSDGDASDPTWEDLFRILYSSDEEILVSGVGCVTGSVFLNAPLDSSARWDNTESNVPFGVGRQSAAATRYGYAFHEACWTLLGQAWAPKPIPTTRLYEATQCAPIPSQLGVAIWDHKYEGLISAEENSYPWADLYVRNELAFTSSDPYHVPEIQQLPHETPVLPAVLTTVPSSKSSSNFAALPLEIIIYISLHLSTTDFLNARSALRQFYPVFYTQQFWASRFLPHAERSWVFEFKNWDLGKVDCLWLYHRTAGSSLGMKNRARVWRIQEKLEGILNSEWRATFPSYSCDDLLPKKWSEAAADLNIETFGLVGSLRLARGCRRTRHSHVRVPSNQLSQLAFSLVRPGDVTYISGIKFILSHDEPVQMGYMTNEQRFVDVRCLTGLRLAIGARGIQGVQCILDGDRDCPWVGCPDSAPQTNRLVFSRCITELKAGFDGSKMVSLAAIAGNFPSQENLRDSALWYPRIPEKDLYLHEAAFAPRENAIGRFYEPICWTMFGGPSGAHLPSLTSISVTAGTGCPQIIEFHHNNEGVPAYCRKVGRCIPINGADTMHFKIDGPGGEVINSLTINMFDFINNGPMPWYYSPGLLESFKVLTNRGRSYHFAATPTTPGGSDAFERPKTIITNSTILGLYWTQHQNRIMALGPITEMPSDEDRARDAEDEVKHMGYMRWPIIQILFNDLTSPPEYPLGAYMWNNILPYYFSLDHEYNIDAGRSRRDAWADSAVRYVYRGFMRKVILIAIENTRVSNEGLDAVWFAEREKLLECMLMARLSNPGPPYLAGSAMYGIVTVGRYSRFYMLFPDMAELYTICSSSVDYIGQPLHFVHDEVWVHKLLWEILERTCQ